MKQSLGEFLVSSRYFLQVQSLAFLPHPPQTPFLIGFPQILHGVHPHVWHIPAPHDLLLTVVLQLTILLTLESTKVI
jgi:hypothetical protein